ncbi:nucleolar MIF4G domain-containing protein 1 [Triplophysa rosa]|uniref:Nucleolar MIF4G domain-containing protein 1 n=1 Tax=Triplophysa rosa TaxID=992332 RepID=A0A9W8CBS8_TRIRA|nr:nucleolar MIF4G domain-containing protein 1 [Triplophysa rosa]KAI7814901.1 putative nucleolar MIF4G domain-containing protein 1 [Triplophysa rosa]
MKTKAQRRSKGKGGLKRQNGKLQEFRDTVDNFVKSKGGFDENKHDKRATFIKRKSRKVLRRETRKSKKARKKCHYMGLSFNVPNQSEEPAPKTTEKGTKSGNSGVKPTGNLKTASHGPQETNDDNVVTKDVEAKSKRKVHFSEDVPKQRKKSKLEEGRKRALKEANIEEDKEIKRLEKRLGFNKRKKKNTLPQSFTNDGLDYILGILEPGASATGLYESDEEMDIDKAKDNFNGLEDSEGETTDDEKKDDSEGDNDTASEEVDEEVDPQLEDVEDLEDRAQLDEDEEEAEDDEEQSDTDASEANDDGEEVESEQRPPDSKEPNPSSVAKYVPPHLREAADSKRKVELEKLKRSVKGLINRLSQPNMASISSQLEELYMSTSRKDMNDTLTDILLAACVTPTLMPERLLMEHILLVSILHHTVGLEVGAHFLETVVRRFDKTYGDDATIDKECDNLVCIIAHLYNFHVVHALLVFDILKKLVTRFSSKDIELVLLVLKNVGFVLRKDDPLALKELISEAQRKASAEGEHFQDQTRIRFMLETMLALKNNDMRKIPGYDPEPVEKLKKLQRTLIHSSASGSDVKLRVSLENVLDADRVGRWWIVGSSWSGAPMIDDHGNKTSTQPTTGKQYSAKILELARKQRMNTDIRRNIFCVLMSSEDYLDAFEKLLRLGLKDQQEREIVHVLMDCCLQEKSFNRFYAVLGEKFCSHDRRFQMTFQFSLWDKFRDLANLSSSSFSNLVQLVTHFVQRKCLSLSILKAIEFGALDKPKVKFLKQILLKLLKETEPEDLVNIFGRISGIPKLGMLREGLKLFISHFLLRNTQTQEPAEQAKVLLDRAEVATKAMEALEAKLKL